jgi:hypothetical protein
MKKSEAREISQNTKFTKLDCYMMLKEALDTKDDSFWKKPSSNSSIDIGAYFNLCVRWVGYSKGASEKDFVSEIVAFRVLHIFGEYSKIQPNKKRKKQKQSIKVSEKPSLVNRL